MPRRATDRRAALLLSPSVAPIDGTTLALPRSNGRDPVAGDPPHMALARADPPHGKGTYATGDLIHDALTSPSPFSKQ
ncbi:hypothetical protein E2562_000271, partial [Oryza meyeriana var. granulata]